MSKGQKNEWGLNEEQELFAIEYFTTKNATQAYLNVKPHCKWSTALTNAPVLLRTPEVQAYLKFLMDTVRNDKIMTAEEVLIQLTDVAKGKDAHLPVHQRVYTKERVKALELLAKHYELLTEISKQEVRQTVTIVDDIEELLEDYSAHCELTEQEIALVDPPIKAKSGKK